MGLIFLSYLHHLNGEDGGLLHTKVEKIFRRPIFHSIFAPPVQSFAADGVYSADTYDTRARKMKEQELSERCREGDRDAWHELYDRYGGRLLALMREKYPADTVFLGESEAPGGDPAADPELVKHAEWAAQLREKHSFTAESVEEILRQEIGLVFARVLDHAGVFKCTPAGRDAFLRFVGAVR